MTTTESPTPVLTVFALWAISIGGSLTRTVRLAVRDSATGQEWDVAFEAIRGSNADRFANVIRDDLNAFDRECDRGTPVETLSLPRIFSVYNEDVDDFFAGVIGHPNVTLRSSRLSWVEREPEDRVIDNARKTVKDE